MASILIPSSRTSCWKPELSPSHRRLFRHCMSGATQGNAWLWIPSEMLQAIPAQQLTALTSSSRGRGCCREAMGCSCTCTWATGFVCSDQERPIHQQLLKEGKRFPWHFNSLLCWAIFRCYCCQSCQILWVFWVFAELHNKRFSSLVHNGGVICWKSYYFKWSLIWRSIH